MKQNILKKVHLIYGIVLSLFILAVGVLFILSCLDIYNGGDPLYSREAVAKHFRAIAVPVYITLLVAVGGIVLTLVFPLEKPKTKAMRDGDDTLKALRGRVGSAVPMREPHLRLALRSIAAVLSVGLAVYPILYFLDPSHFELLDINGSVIAAVVPALIFALIVSALAIVCAYLCNRSVQREIAACKTALAEKKTAPAENGAADTRECPTDAVKPHGKKAVLAIRLTLVVLSLVLIVLGVLNGGDSDVLDKAIRICTECIGLG